jgi:hypothetical protein
LIRELVAGGTLGEALRRAKRAADDPDFVRQYNLLGDPALPLPHRGASAELKMVSGLRPTVRGDLTMSSPPGRVRVEWLDRSGALVDAAEMAPVGGAFSASIAAAVDIGSLAGVRVSVPDGPAAGESLGALALDGTLLARWHSNTIKWKTASEIENYGFEVYRGESPNGPFIRLTEQPIAGAGTTDEPHSYEFVDVATDPARVYYYYVESISLSSERQRITPVQEAVGELADGEQRAGPAADRRGRAPGS